MSNTIKDKPSRVLYEDLHKDQEHVGPFNWIHLPTTKTKKKKRVDTEWHWMSTPSWWTRLMMNRPQRRKSKTWEQNIRKLPSLTEEALLDQDFPSVSKKPHQYYW